MVLSSPSTADLSLSVFTLPVMLGCAIAAVAINNRYYYLDATNKYLPARITPYDILNTTGFIVNRKNSKLVEILDEEFKYDEAILISGKLTPEGKLVGTAKARSSEYARAVKVRSYRSDSKKFIEHYFTKETDGITIDSFKTTGEDIDTIAFVQEFDFSLPLSTTGDYKFLDLNLFTGQKSNPFILNERFANINFGYKRRVLVTTIVEIPDSYVVDVLPKGKTLVTPDRGISFQKTVNFSEGKLVQNTLMEVNRSYFEADEYPTLKAFYKLMFESISEPVVLKKK